MAQDERLALFASEALGRDYGAGHNAIGLAALPGVARRLLHCRDRVASRGGETMESGEHFDSLTWFEFTPTETPAFEMLLGCLRAAAERSFVERKVEIRLVRAPM